MTSFGDLLKENGPQDSLKIVYITYIYIYMIENTTPPGIDPGIGLPPPCGWGGQERKAVGTFRCVAATACKKTGARDRLFAELA